MSARDLQGPRALQRAKAEAAEASQCASGHPSCQRPFGVYGFGVHAFSWRFLNLLVGLSGIYVHTHISGAFYLTYIYPP